MTIRDKLTPVLVLNAIHYGALGVTRSLGRLAVCVYNQSPLRFVPAFQSRYSRRNILWDQDAAGPEQTVDFLLSFGRTLEYRALLIPTCDVTAMLVADHAETLRTCFQFPNQSKELVHSLCDKNTLHHTAERCGIPTPRTSSPETQKDVVRFLETASFPVVLKTRKNRIGSQTPRALKVIVRNKYDLLEVWNRLSARRDPNIVLQEYIPGGDDSNWMFNGYFNEDSECLFGLTGQKIRQFPPYAGVTSLGVCASNNVVTNMSLAFMRKLQYRGILDMGYRF
ncbi:MAG TPA: hypothetical protein VHI52_18550, partial [Verrucomicrobiae bacterium]|nr:hypothetical protein [Verrucomicrobiae bacterium]